LGPNGAGKSTTVKILTTLSRANAGSATVAGHDVAKSPEAVRRRIGSVTQRNAVDLEATGAENLKLQGHLYGLRGSALQSRVDELLERLGLSAAAKRVALTYSGGMLRKLDVAMGLVHRPSVLFLDEPTTGLDPEARSEMWQEISRLSREERLTVLLTTHYLEEADRLADRIAIIDAGRVVAEGTSDELKSELKGDAVVLQLALPAGSALAVDTEGPVASAMAALADVVRDGTVDGRSFRARVADGASALPAVIAAFESAGVPVTSATIARPSLDDVYLRHTGHAYETDKEGLK
ncbi:MAG TPA: ATP-binding cassette domain-containing protein, partial [Acidimicrobiales bacterium]|nr:ATP-binding cassette domain-containing protein [Acidimicrobiales bacterium]